MNLHRCRAAATSRPHDTPHVYLAHGFRIASPQGLHALALAEDGGSGADLTIAWPDPSTSQLEAARSVDTLIRCESAGVVRYTVTRHAGTYHLHFRGCGHFIVAADLSMAACRPERGAVPDLMTVLASGALLAFVMEMAGRCVLHASAVQIGDGAVAVAGGSGFGKSTVTAALCTVGGRLVTDDVLRVDLDDDTPPVVHRGTHEIRLRVGARPLVQRFDSPVSLRETPDGRLAIRPRRAGPSILPLRALVVPRPRADISAVAVQPVSSMPALRLLLAHPRLVGWRHPPVLQRQLKNLANLTQQIPLFVAHLPLGHPFPHEVSEQLFGQLSAIVRV